MVALSGSLKVEGGESVSDKDNAVQCGVIQKYEAKL